MSVPSSIADISTTAASNSPSGSEAIGTSLDDYMRSIQAIIKQESSRGSDITAASSITVPNAGRYFVVTGNTGISSIADSWQGRTVVLEFSGTPTLTHSSGLILPGSANITAAAGDVFVVSNKSTGVWRVVAYQPAGGNLTAASIGVSVQGYNANTIAVAPGTSGNVLTSTGAAWSSAPLQTGMPRSYIAGLGLANNGSDATNDIDIAVGACRDSTNAADIVLASALTKQLDAAWAVGTNQGGLDTGSIANTTYHVWLIKRSDTGVVDALFSASASAPTMPANYDYKRRIGSIVRTGGAIKAFVQDGDYFRWLATVLDVNDTTTAATSRTLTVPLGVNVLAFGALTLEASTGTPFCVLSDLAANAETPANNAAPLGVGSLNSALGQGGWPWQVRTNTSAQIRSQIGAAGGATTLRIATYGWIDSRGSNA